MNKIFWSVFFSMGIFTQTCFAKYDFAVIIDPGHGGDDSGATQIHRKKLVVEKNISLQVSLKTARKLRSMGIPTFLTRTRDQSVSLDQRIEKANLIAAQAKEAVFISIHVNSSDEHKGNGVETFVFNGASNYASERLSEIENGTYKINGRPAVKAQSPHSTLDLIFADLSTSSNYTDSVNFAQNVQSSIVSGLDERGLPVRDRGIKKALFYVLMQTRMPGILLELGFLSNPHELIRLTHKKYQKFLASRIALGVVHFKERSFKLAKSNY